MAAGPKSLLLSSLVGAKQHKFLTDKESSLVKANSICRTLFAAVLGIASASLLSAQSYLGGIRGLIRDAGGSVVVNAKVTLINSATQVSRSSITNTQGEYVFSQIDPATYTLAVESPGFKKLQKNGVIVGTQQFLTIDLKLDVGEVTTSVQVTEDVPLIESANASAAYVIIATSGDR